MIPQLLYIALAFLSLGISLSEHGKPKTGKNNAWITVISVLLGAVLVYCGGFFDPLTK